MKIMLVCNQGLSTSILVSKMNQAVKNSEKFANKGIEIIAWGKEEYMDHLENTNVIMLGPQISMAKRDIEKTIEKYGFNIPVVLIGREDYGMMNTTNILRSAFLSKRESK